MKVILSKQCESLTGMLRTDLGYFLVKRKDNFYSVRSKHYVPADGHIQFIFTCAELAQNKLHMTDIEVHWVELKTALYEAHLFMAAQQVRDNYANKGKVIYDARDILNLKTTFGL